MNKVGIIQGRLSPRPYPLLQKFPENTWRQEFFTAAEIGYDFIEWIFEENGFERNPIWSYTGRKEIKSLIEETSIPVESICADFFLENPFFRRGKYELEGLIEKLKILIEYAAEIGVKVILLPVLEKAEIKCSEDEGILIHALNQCLPELEQYQIKIGLETELPAKKYLSLVSCMGSKYIGAYYDAGNCAFRGFDMKKDMEILHPMLFQVHIKDRIVNGGSVFLGTGDTNLSEGIPYLQSIGYSGNYVLQTWFEDDYRGTAEMNLKFIRSLME